MWCMNELYIRKASQNFEYVPSIERKRLQWPRMIEHCLISVCVYTHGLRVHIRHRVYNDETLATIQQSWNAENKRYICFPSTDIQRAIVFTYTSCSCRNRVQNNTHRNSDDEAKRARKIIPWRSRWSVVKWWLMVVWGKERARCIRCEIFYFVVASEKTKSENRTAFTRCCAVCAVRMCAP